MSVHEVNLSKIETHGSLTEPDLVNRVGGLTAGSCTLEVYSSHGNSRHVGRRVVVMKKHAMTQLPPSFLFDTDSCMKFPDLVGIVDTCNSLSLFHLVDHQYAGSVINLGGLQPFFPVTKGVEKILVTMF